MAEILSCVLRRGRDRVRHLAATKHARPSEASAQPVLHTVAPGVRQSAEVFATEAAKFERLLQLVAERAATRTVVSASSHGDAAELVAQLRSKGVDVSLLSGEADALERAHTLAEFTSPHRPPRPLVATAIMTRQLTAQSGVRTVINAAPPAYEADYAYRANLVATTAGGGEVITLIGPETKEGNDATAVINVMQASGAHAAITPDLQRIAEMHARKRARAAIAEVAPFTLQPPPSGFRFDPEPTGTCSHRRL